MFANTTLEAIRRGLEHGQKRLRLPIRLGYPSTRRSFSPDSKVLGDWHNFDKAFAGLPESVKKAAGITEDFSSVKLWTLPM